MVDPYTALGAASAVVQFIQFAAQVLKETSKIRNGTDQSQVDRLKAEAQRLKSLGTRLRSMCGSDPSTATSVPLEATKAAADCDDLAKEILALVNKLDAQGKRRSFESFQLALQRERKKREMDILEKKLANLRPEVLMVLTQTLSDQKTSDFAREMHRLRQQDERMNLDLTNAVQNLRQEVQDVLAGQRQAADLDQFLLMALEKLCERGKAADYGQRILYSLRYSEMRRRHDAVAVSHPETYEWMLDPAQSELHPDRPKTTFVEWLQSGSGIFWVSGKAGSGKSTLMKFLCNHEKTKQSLKTWAGSAELIVASQYFWLNGYELQKSMAGLLRKLCYDVFHQYPDLLPVVCHEEWTRRTGPNDDTELWTEETLRTLLKRLAKPDLRIDGRKIRLCFFIDGLDEFHGEHRELVRLLQDLVQSGQIKVCASSRPWNPFLDSFGQYPERMVKLEDLNHKDISTYVHDHLCSDENFRHLSATRTFAETIATQVTNRAQGVFLWVYLVTKQLLRGLENGDSLSDLQRRLDAMPSDLEEYFRSIFNSLDEFYGERTARTFLILLAVKVPLPLLGFSFLENDDISAQCPDKCRINPSTQNGEKQESSTDTHASCVAEMSSNLWRRINGRCRDLLERDVHKLGPFHIDQTPSLSAMFYNVDFLHRTVRDFLEGTETLALLQQRAGKDFDPLAAVYEVYKCEVFRNPLTLHHDGDAFLYAWMTMGSMLIYCPYSLGAQTLDKHTLSEDTFLALDSIRLSFQDGEYSDLFATRYQPLPGRRDIQFGMTPSETFVFLAVSMKHYSYLRDLAQRAQEGLVGNGCSVLCTAAILRDYFYLDADSDRFLSTDGKRALLRGGYANMCVSIFDLDCSVLELLTRAFPFDPTAQPATQILFRSGPDEAVTRSFWDEYCHLLMSLRLSRNSAIRNETLRSNSFRKNETKPDPMKDGRARYVTQLLLNMIPESRRREELSQNVFKNFFNNQSANELTGALQNRGQNDLEKGHESVYFRSLSPVHIQEKAHIA